MNEDLSPFWDFKVGDEVIVIDPSSPYFLQECTLTEWWPNGCQGWHSDDNNHLKPHFDTDLDPHLGDEDKVEYWEVVYMRPHQIAPKNPGSSIVREDITEKDRLIKLEE